MIWTHPGAPEETGCKIISGNLDTCHVTIEYDNGRRESKYIAELRATGGIAEVSAEILKVNMKEMYNMRCFKMTKDEIKNKIRICHRFIKPGYWRIRKPELIQILNTIWIDFDKMNLKPRGNRQLANAINMLTETDLIRWNGNHVFWLTSKFWTLNF